MNLVFTVVTFFYWKKQTRRNDSNLPKLHGTAAFPITNYGHESLDFVHIGMRLMQVNKYDTSVLEPLCKIHSVIP